MNLLDDSLSTDLATNGRGLDAVMHERFQRLAQYAVDAGCNGILFTCSAFGSCIEAVAQRHPNIPVHKPNEAMIEDAVKLAGTTQQNRPDRQLRTDLSLHATRIPHRHQPRNPIGS